MFCQKCGTQLNDDAVFCGKCGCKISSTTEQSTENNNIVIDTQSVTNQQPTYQQPVYQQPVPQQPVYQQPVYQQPVYQQPVYQQPVYQQPIPQQSVPQSVQPEPIPVSKQVFDTPPVPPDINSPVQSPEFIKPTKNISGKFSDFYKKITSNKKLLIISIVSLVVIISLIVIIVISVTPPSLVGTWGESVAVYVFDSDNTGKEIFFIGVGEHISKDFTWKKRGSRLYLYFDDNDLTKKFTYTFDHDFLILQSCDDPSVISLTGKKLSSDTDLSLDDIRSLLSEYQYSTSTMGYIYRFYYNEEN